MTSGDYHFVTHWKVKGKMSDVYAVLTNATEYPRWWGDCYLQVVEIEPTDANGLNGKTKIVNRGKLPYTLTWYSSLISHTPPSGFIIEATGELNGKGTWKFVQEGEWVLITFYWDVSLGQSWLRLFSYLLKPILISNHNWVMNLGEKHLQEELDRLADS